MSFEELLTGVNDTSNVIKSELADINDAANNLTYNIIPELLNVTGLWAVVTNATRCDYITHVFNETKHLLCYDLRGATATFVTTHLVALATLLFACFTASFAYLAFKHPYKPFHYSYHDTPQFESGDDDEDEWQTTSSMRMPSFQASSFEKPKKLTTVASKQVYVAL